MQWYCRKSGLPLASAQDDYQSILFSEHAIFGLSAADLFKFIAKNPPNNPVQKRIVYLALLNLTGLVDWQSAFCPSEEEIELTFRDLLQFVTNLPPQDRLADYPRIRISAHCAPDVAHILYTWRATRMGLRIEDNASKADIELALSEAMNRYTIKALQDRHIQFAARWLNRNSDKSDALISVYLDRLKLTQAQLKLNHVTVLEEMLEELKLCLPDDDTQDRHISFYILRHVQNLLDSLVQLGAELSGKDWSSKRTELAGVSTFRIVEDEKPQLTKEEKEARRQAIAARPIPELKNFSSIPEYARAKAQWVRENAEL
jgi:hypothetical protein